jgi:TolC family type I secretion outer membrane protein
LKRQLEASRDRFQVGEITRTDVAQSESRLSGATSARVAAAGALRASRAAYAEVVGKPAPKDLASASPLEGLPASLDETVTQARANNPAVVSASYAESASTNAVREVSGELFPQVSLQGDLVHAEDATTDGVKTDQARILAQVRVPLYQAGFVSSRVRAAKQTESQRRLELDQARRSAERDAVAAWEGLRTAQAQISSFQSQVKAAQIALEGVRQENAVGSRTVLDVLNAEQELLDAQVSLVRAQRDEIIAGFQVLSAVGRLNAKELGLKVAVYDPESDYKAVRDSWFGLSAPGQ